MILVDSSVWIDYFNGVKNDQTDFLHEGLGAQTFAIGDLILVEVLQGFKTEKAFKQANHLFSELFYFDMLGREVALKAASNYRFLRKRGFTIRKTVDVMIATFCIVHEISLLHNDKDFKIAESQLDLKVASI
ncbi:MAG TPA: PIN domain nuclease [Cryomorphaceae bacterium]|nr:PIN domain nuclease [Cryomorphaceae bacterium]